MCFSCKDKDQKSIAISQEPDNIKATETKLQFLSKKFKDYWYDGTAEITSYKLEQARYGELREGTAVLVFVTEPFDNKLQVKADYPNTSNIPVLKLNSTKNFNTGVYPYSIMQSTFYPVSNDQHAIKVSSSIQEWCGQVYAQLNNRDQFEFTSHSYFQSEADQNIKLDKTILENELWNQLRINPSSLPVGELEIIPSLEFLRLKHVPIKPYKAYVTLNKGTYTINYRDLERSLTINFDVQFPYTIESWEETSKSGFGSNLKTLTSKATRLERIKSAYWNKNSNSDQGLRTTLKLQ